MTVWKIVLIGCGVCVAYFAGKITAGKVKEQVIKAGAGTDGSPMSILAKGVLCVHKNIGPWSAQDVVLGLVAMAKVTEKEPLEIPGRPVDDLSNDPVFLLKAQHWRALAEAIYVGDAASFSLFSHLPESFIVTAQYNPDQNTMRPAYALAVDPSYGALVLSIRGTQHVMDLLVSAGTSLVPFMGGYAHSGFVRATEVLLEECRSSIDDVFKQAEDYNVKKLVIVGHSMGAAIAIMCGLKLREDYHDLECWGYSVPASISLELAKQCSSFSTCFVGLHDVVPRFSLASVEDLRQRICNFDWKKAEEIAGGDEDWEKISKAVQVMESFQRAQDSVEQNFDDFQNKVCSAVSKDGDNKTDGSGSASCDDDHKSESGDVDPPALYPPGRLLVLASYPPGCGVSPGQRSGVAEQRNYGAFPSFEQARNVKWVMHEAVQEDFAQISLSPWSISDHVLGHMCEGISYLQKRSTNAV